MWSEPMAITDSLVDNRNASIAYLQLHGEWGSYIFWERSMDESSTAIFYRNLYTADEPQAIHETAGVHYRNPRFVETWNEDEDTLCFFFYESNQSGNFDLYYQVLTLDGFSEPVALAATPADEIHFRCNGSGTLTWQEGDKIKYALLDVYWNQAFNLSVPATLDSIGCSSPDVPWASSYSGRTSIAWLKGSPDDSAIWYSYYNWQANAYSTPELLADEAGTIGNMRFDNDACYGAVNTGEILAWENVEGDLHSLRLMNIWGSGSDSGFVAEFQQEQDFMPIFSDYITPMDEQDFHGFLGFIDATNGNGDIRVSEQEWELSVNLEDYYNISGSPYEETNPAFFNGSCEIYWCDLVLTWESLRDGHWQIWYSTANLMCAGGTEENDAEEIEMNIYPNPANSAFEVCYELPSDTWIRLKLLTMDGSQIVLTDHEFQQQGQHNIRVYVDDLIPGMRSGMFLIQLETGNGCSVKKLFIVK
jgi:hypothetical protein